MKIPEKGFYYHYKSDSHGPINNHAYEVVGVALQTEDGSYLVIYRPLYENTFLARANFCARPLEMFLGMIEKDGVSIPRFKKITDESVIAQLQRMK